MMVARTSSLGFLGLLGGVVAGGPPGIASSKFTAWDDKTYTSISTEPSSISYQEWLTQSNGYIGLAQCRLGPFFETSRLDDGAGPRHTFATISGFWSDGEGDESGGATAGIPHFTDLLVQACGSTLNGSVDTAEISDFTSTLSFLEGIATWTYLWTPPGCPGGTTLGIAYEAFLSLDSRQLAATRLSVSSTSSMSSSSSSDPDVEVGIVDVLDGRGAAAGGRTANFQTRFFPGPRRGILASVSPAGRGDGTAAYIYSTVSDPDFPPSASSMSSDPEALSVSQTYTVQLGPGVGRFTTTAVKYVGVASTDHFDNAPNVAMQTAIRASKAGWDVLRSAHGVPHKAPGQVGDKPGTGHDEL